MEEIIVWRMGVLVGIVIFTTVCYWITADLENGNDEKENKKKEQCCDHYSKDEKFLGNLTSHNRIIQVFP